MRIAIYVHRSMLALAGFAISTGATASAQYTFVKVKVPKASTHFTAPLGISNQNALAGSFELLHVGTQGFVRTNGHPPVWTYYADPSGDNTNTTATGINSAGTIVGYYEVTTNTFAGMIYSGGQYNTFNVAGCLSTYITGINDKGDTAGYCAANGTYTGWVNLVRSGLTSFVIPGATQTFMTGLNSLDQVGGYYNNGNPSNSHGFVSPAAGFVTTVDYPSAISTYVLGVGDKSIGSNAGWICGTFVDTSSNYHGFLFNGLTYTQIDVPNATHTVITGVNRNGWLTGSYIDSQGVSFGYYAKPSAGASVLLDEE